MPYVHLLPLAAALPARRQAAARHLVRVLGRLLARLRRRGEGAGLPRGRVADGAARHARRRRRSRLTAERLAPRRGGAAAWSWCRAASRWRAVRAAAAARPRPGAPPLVFAGRLLAHKRLDAAARGAAAPGGDDRRRRRRCSRSSARGRSGSGWRRWRGELGVAARVRFRGHVETSEEVWRALGGARIAVQPSAREGLRPVSAGGDGGGAAGGVLRVGGERRAELVRDGVEGVCCAPTAEALASTLERLLVDDDERRRDSLVERARGRSSTTGRRSRDGSKRSSGRWLGALDRPFRCGVPQVSSAPGAPLCPRFACWYRGALPANTVLPSSPRTVDCQGERTERPALQRPAGPSTGGGAPARGAVPSPLVIPSVSEGSGGRVARRPTSIAPPPAQILRSRSG